MLSMPRISNVTIKRPSASPIIGDVITSWEAALFQCLDLCVFAEQQQQQQRQQTQQQEETTATSTSGMTATVLTPALTSLHVDFDLNRYFSFAHAPIIRRLCTEYIEATRSLEALLIKGNSYDDGPDLGGVLAALPHLCALTLQDCGLTSLRLLSASGGCANNKLEKLDLLGCRALVSLDGMQHEGAFPLLAELVVADTPLTHIRELRGCTALRKVSLSLCEELTTLEGLGDLQHLEEIDASVTAITSVREIRTCSALTELNVINCNYLLTLDDDIRDLSINYCQ